MRVRGHPTLTADDGAPLQEKTMPAKKQGLYANIHAKQERIKNGSGEHMRKPGSPGAPDKEDFDKSAKTAKSKKPSH
jgi:hypothetical protein